MNHTEFKNSVIAQDKPTTLREALPMLVLGTVLLAAVLVAFANAIN